MSGVLAQRTGEWTLRNPGSFRQGRQSRLDGNFAGWEHKTRNDSSRSQHIRRKSPITAIPAIKIRVLAMSFFAFSLGIQATFSLLFNSTSVFQSPSRKPLTDSSQFKEPTHISTWVILLGLPVCLSNHQRKVVLVKDSDWNVSPQNHLHTDGLSGSNNSCVWLHKVHSFRLNKQTNKCTKKLSLRLWFLRCSIWIFS